MERNSEQVLPEGWAAEFFAKADYELSFDALSACRHFYAEVMRGRIRSLQFRLTEAASHFAHALELYPNAPPTIASMVRRALLHVYWLENTILQEPISIAKAIEPLWFPRIGKGIAEEFPEAKFVERMRDSVNGLLLLHHGQYRRSLSIYQRLIATDDGRREDILAGYYLGLAACQYNLGFRRASLRSMENAGLALQVGGSTLNRVKGAATLEAFYICLERPADAAEWVAFLGRLPCPSTTIEASRARSRVFVDRWVAESRLLLV